MVLRASQHADIPAIAAIYAHYVRHSTASFETEPPDYSEMANRRARILHAGLPWLVAEIDGTIAGYAYAGPYRPRAAYRFTVENSIYLDPACAGKGLGSALMVRLLEDCEAWGARQMIAVIGGSDNHASIKLHQKFGFRHTGTLLAAGFKFGRWVDTVMMQRALGHGDSIPPDPGR
jgi:L-amino acid N-acyltransferase YncA